MNSVSEPSFLDTPPLRGLRISLLLTGCFVLLLVVLLESTRGLPFSSTDDGPTYFLPLIKAHTDNWLSGAPGAYIWDLGSGHSVWESGQVGALYLPYVLSNMLARLIGEPLLLLEVSAVLHLLAAGLIAAWLLPASWSTVDRTLGATLLAAQPAPLILGTNWHVYISSYPWFLALVLLCEQPTAATNWSRKRRLGVLIASLGFLMTAHPQMLILGLALVTTRCLSGEGSLRIRLQNLVSFGIAQIPALVTMSYLFLVSRDATTDSMWGRNQADYLASRGQSLGVVVHGLLFGNLVENHDFRLWGEVSWTGIGMFFAPWLVISVFSCLRRRKLIWPFLALALLGLTAIGTFPELSILAVGPLQGFRWTWKLTWLLGPLSAVIALMYLSPQDRQRRLTRALAGLAVLACVLVSVRGMQFDLMPSLRHAQPRGVLTIVEETRRLKTEVGMADGDRIAILAAFPLHADAVSLALLGLSGNAPLLAGLGSVHLFEPMEPQAVSESHLLLSKPWTRPVPLDNYRQDPETVERLLAGLGGRWLVASDPSLLEGPAVHRFVGRDGLPLFVREIPPPIAPWPRGFRDRKLVPVEALDNGMVITSRPEALPPDLLIGREVEWSPVDDGRLLGRVQLLATSWVVAQIVATGTALLLLVSLPLHPFFRRPLT